MISVIVPVYRSEQTLERCVDSILHQTNQDLEILLVLNGKKDVSYMLAKQLEAKDARIRVLRREKKGVSNARNMGIREAKGDYIRFVDSDDYIEQNSNELLLTCMQEQNCDIVIAGYTHEYFGKNIVKIPKQHTFSTIPYGEEDAIELIKLYLEGYLNMPWNKLYKKQKITSYFPTDLNLGEDLLFNEACYLEATKIAILPKSVCHYIQDDRGTTLSTKIRTDRIDIAFRLYEQSFKFFQRLAIKDVSFLKKKLIKEFMDETEQIAFMKDTDTIIKKKCVADYIEAFNKLSYAEKEIVFEKLDYKILYYLFRKHQPRMIYYFIHMRALVVKIIRRRG